MTPRNIVLEGDAAATLRTLAEGSVDCVITSPPYFLARDYHAGDLELGREASIEGWVNHLRGVVAEIARVLVPTGSLWLNLGDGYSTHARLGAPRKSLLLGPERLIRALQTDGWIVRNKVVWAKSTPMPSPVSDRLTNTWEPVFHLVRQPSYWYDLDSIRVPLVSGPRRPSGLGARRAPLGQLASPRFGLARLAAEGRSGHPLGKNPGDLWTLPPGRRVEGHQATFPEALARRPILATAPPVVCTACVQPWRRSKRQVRFLEGKPQGRPFVPCGCNAPTRKGLVLDPFAGSGTTLRVARELHRDALGIELSPVFARLARERAGLVEAPLAKAA
jgi:site-specific DNA-methyltransferase (adenine-specific)